TSVEARAGDSRLHGAQACLVIEPIQNSAITHGRCFLCRQGPAARKLGCQCARRRYCCTVQEEEGMAKADRAATTNRLHSAARLARTALAARLLAHGFYAGQDQIMLALAREDGQTPGSLAERLGVRPPTITKTINRLQAQGFVEK